MNKKITEIDFINDSNIKSIVIKIDNIWFELGFMDNVSTIEDAIKGTEKFLNELKEHKNVIYKKSYLLTYDGVTKFLGIVDYQSKYYDIEDIIKVLEKEHKDNYPNFQKIWLE